MQALGALVWIVALGSPALAAGGWDEMPTFYFTMALLWLTVPVGLPSVGLGFFLQGLMRPRNAIILLGLGVLAIASFGIFTRGVARTLQLAPTFATMLLLSPPFSASAGTSESGMRTATQKIKS